jgi:thiamine kinase-like enzyme
MPVIEDVIARIPEWRGKSILIHPVGGGLTNANFKVSVDGKSFFVRVPGEKTELLAVDRNNEYFNSLAAAQTGIGPQVFFYISEYKAMVLEYLEGQTMSIAALAAVGMPARIAQAIKRLHAGPRFLTDFNMFRLTEYYLDVCKQHSIPIPDGYPQRLPIIRHVEEAMQFHPLPTVPCNNDLLAENYIDDGQAIRIIDYEYSGNNDPCFELGNTCQELNYDEARITELCQSYFGIVREDIISRMKLNMIMSDVGWALWAAIQASISKIDYDFWGWATERWCRAVEKMDAPEFPAWIENVSKYPNRKVV